MKKMKINITYEREKLKELSQNIVTGSIDFNKMLKNSLKFPEDIPICEWAENNFYIPTLQSSKSGYINFYLTPYLKGILNAFADDDIRTITIKKPTQTGGTLTLTMLMAYIIDQKPGNALIVFPRKSDAEAFSIERFKPSLESSPTLRKHLKTDNSRDFTKLTYRFKNCHFHFGWATSASELASKPKKNLFADEVDKYEEELGKEADPLSLAMERLKTYPDSKCVIASTPTNRYGIVSKKFDESDQCHFQCKCPKCGEYQKLSFYNIKLPEGFKRDINDIIKKQPCYYECMYCKHQIPENEKLEFINSGKWIADKPNVLRHKGFHISGLLSPDLSFSEILAEHIKVKRSMSSVAKKHFTNSTLGDYYEEDVNSIAVVRDKVVDLEHNRHIVSEDCGYIITGVDVQEDRFYFTTYEYCFGRKINLIDHGMLRRFDEVENLVHKEYFTKSGNMFRNIRIAIDAGYKSTEVYNVCAKYPSVMIPVRGDRIIRNENYKFFPCFKDDMGNPISGSIHYAMLNTIVYKDKFYQDYIKHNMLKIHNESDDILINMLNSEYKVYKRNPNGIRVPKYEIKPGHGDSNHYLDTTIYSIAMADIIGYFTDRNFDYEKEEIKTIVKKQKEIQTQNKKEENDKLKIRRELMQLNKNKNKVDNYVGTNKKWI